MANDKNKRITYAELIERITTAEKNYHMARTNHMAGGQQRDDNASHMSGARRMNSAASEAFLP